MPAKRARRRRAPALPPPPEGPSLLSATATEAQNGFGKYLELVTGRQAVVITRHATPRAVLLSADLYATLVEAHRDRLARLEQDFDAMLERMQAPAARAGVARAFRATPRRIAAAAVKAAARPRGKS